MNQQVNFRTGEGELWHELMRCATERNRFASVPILKEYRLVGGITNKIRTCPTLLDNARTRNLNFINLDPSC
ncbi:hypothetical protein CUMW_073010 [Citrus unshiu]|nr:hypothetical protein CUMW_073010 [Citrus unshiu]